MEFAIGRGKTKRDKRDVMKKRDADRTIKRKLKSNLLKI
jgi:tmRNA-binding protein